MTYANVSVPKKSANAGRPKGKLSYIMIFDFEDIDNYERDANGVRVAALTFKAGKAPIAVYATDSTIKGYHSSEGEDDARGFIHHVEFEHPGTSLEFDQFTNNNINKNLGAVVLRCGDVDAKLFGSKSAPLKMTKADTEDSKDADKNIINLATTLRTDTTGYIAKALLPATDSVAINAELGLPATAGSAGGGM